MSERIISPVPENTPNLAKQMDVLQRLCEELQQGNFDLMADLTREALRQGIEPGRILNEALVAGMDIVGDKFRRDEIFLPEVLISAKAMQASMDVLRPSLVGAGVRMAGKIVLGTVKGDIHDIGKNLVGMLREGAGYEVINLGTDVSAEKFVQSVKANQPNLVGLSALLTTTMLGMKDIIHSFVEAGVRDKIKVVVGGAPVTEDFARNVEADGYAPDAARAVEKVRELIG